jgi:hypothetical protein
MQPLNAVVKNGRLTLDEPTDLPDGQVVVLLPLEELLAAADGFSGDEDIAANRGVTFEIMRAPAPREWKKPKAPDAASLIAELRAL